MNKTPPAEWVSVSQLREWPDNPRRNDDNVERVAESIKRFGFSAPIIARSENREIIAGHTRYRAAHLLGLTEVPVRFMDLDEREAHLLALADNKLTETSEWDDLSLAKVLSRYGLEEAGLAGFNAKEIEQLATSLLRESPVDPDQQEIEESDIPKRFNGQNDYAIIGEHLLYCGNSESGDYWPAFSKARQGMPAASCVWTDPPYNVGGRTKMVCSDIRPNSFGELKAARWDQTFDPIKFLDALGDYVAKDASFYICASHFTAPDTWQWLNDHCDFYSYLVWTKPSPMPSMSKRHWTWSTELICYGTRQGHTFNFPPEGHAFSHIEANPVRGIPHPTSKPVELIERCLERSTNIGDVVLDPFGGSGSTLLACERLHRKAVLCELDPTYCDLIVHRWEMMTGQKAEVINGPAHEANGSDKETDLRSSADRSSS